MCYLLKLPDQHIKDFISIELNYENKNLILNPIVSAIFDFVKKELKGHVILISDMYMRKEQILALIKMKNLDTSNLITSIFSSADEKLSKKSGKIFSKIEKKLNSRPHSFVHIGDSLDGDFKKPIEKGWNAIHLPLPNCLLEEIYEDMKKTETFLLEKGINLNDWLPYSI
jgi:predicted HAD superfamily hydrolase